MKLVTVLLGLGCGLGSIMPACAQWGGGGRMLTPPPPAAAPPIPPSGGGVPIPATAAGFTTPALKVDFTAVASTWPNSNIVECGASESVGGSPSSWHFHVTAPGNVGLPCARTSIVTDTAAGPSGSHQALRFQYLTSDPAPSSGGQGAQFSWPQKPFIGNSGPWMPNGY